METLRNIVLETMHKLYEAKEHADDEIVDYDEIDLQKEYDKLNNLLFGGNLQPVTMLWNTRKTSHGVVKAQRNRRTGLITIQSLMMSKFLEIPYKVFKDVLAHEMIHVHFLQNNINAGHDWRFVREMNRINSMGLGFNVSVTMDSASFAISKHVKQTTKDMVFIVIETDRKKNMVAVTTPKVYQSESGYIQELYENLVRSGRYKWAKGEAYISKNPELLKYTSQRTFKTKFGYRELTDSQIENLKQDAESIGSFAIE